MNFETFELERIQSLYENTVDFNLTESGFHPYTLDELLTTDQLQDLHRTVLGYGQTNGSVALRERIAALFGADPSVINVKGKTGERVGEIDESIEHLAKAAKLAPQGLNKQYSAQRLHQGAGYTDAIKRGS